MGRKTKYRPRFAKYLREGLRLSEYEDKRTGKSYCWSIDRICQSWGITRTTYNAWVDEYTSFKEAHEIGERDFRIYWMQKLEEAVHDKNKSTSALKLVAFNVLGLTDKPAPVAPVAENRIGSINITMIAPPAEADAPQLTNVIDITDAHNKP